MLKKWEPLLRIICILSWWKTCWILTYYILVEINHIQLRVPLCSQGLILEMKMVNILFLSVSWHIIPNNSSFIVHNRIEDSLLSKIYIYIYEKKRGFLFQFLLKKKKTFFLLLLLLFYPQSNNDNKWYIQRRGGVFLSKVELLMMMLSFCK